MFGSSDRASACKRRGKINLFTCHLRQPKDDTISGCYLTWNPSKVKYGCHESCGYRWLIAHLIPPFCWLRYDDCWFWRVREGFPATQTDALPYILRKSDVRALFMMEWSLQCIQFKFKGSRNGYSFGSVINYSKEAIYTSSGLLEREGPSKYHDRYKSKKLYLTKTPNEKYSTWFMDNYSSS